MDKKQRKILLVLFTGVLMGALDISIVGPAIPSIDAFLGITEKEKSWIFSIYILFNLIGISPLARLSDLFGRRLIYILSIGIFGLGSLVASMANSVEILLVGRAIQGFGASGIFPVASATVGDIFPPERRGRILGMIGMVFGLAFIIGPLIAGILLSFFTWHFLFLINLPIALILIFAGWRLLPSDRLVAKSGIDLQGIILFGLFLSSFTIGVNNIDAREFWKSLSSGHSLILLAMSLVFLFAFFYVEKRAELPIVRRSLFKSRQVRIVGGLAFGTGMFQAAFVFVPDMTVDAFHVEASAASFMLLPAVAATAIGSPVSGRLIDKFGSRLVINIALAFMMIGFLVLDFLKDQYSIYYAAGILLGLGLSVLAGSSLRYIMLNEVGAVERASTQGVLTIFIALGQITGSALIGAVTLAKKGLEGYKQAFFILMCFSFVFLLTSFFLKKHKEETRSFKDHS